jgi:hypothetical protein
MLPFAPSSRRLGTVIARWAFTLFSIPAASCFSADTPNYYVTPRGYGLIPESEPPRYVHQADKTGVAAFEGMSWLDIGLDYRVRYEYRDNDFRRSTQVLDDPFLLRTRLYLGIKQRFDPVRVVLELEDARRTRSQFAPDDRDVNIAEPIQAYAELYFAEGLGKDRPLSIKLGRQAFEYIDRRLLARNEWRNTTNNFDGLRATLGRRANDWQLDILALQPVRRLTAELDQPEDSQWLTGAIFDWRRWSQVATLQPYYLRLTQDGARAASRVTRDIHTAGLRAYGVIGKTGWDWDVSGAQQFGEDGPRIHRAQALIVDAGYTATHAWKPRFSASLLYASGDRSPTDGTNQRFERLFGFARPLSADDYIQWENLRSPKVRVEFVPLPSVRVDAGLSAYWLASETDRWNTTGLRDPSGASGTYLGHEFDVRVRFPVGGHIAMNLGYAHFAPGGFTRATSGRSDPSDFVYVEVSIDAFR